MLFPNRPPAPQMTPGMGYAGGANALGYAAGARGMGCSVCDAAMRGLGYIAHMGYAAGARGLGDFSPSEESLALNYGIQQSDLDLLSSLGATDQDLENLINGNITLSQLYAQYGVTIPANATTASGTVDTSSLPLAPTSTVSSTVAPPVPAISTAAASSPAASVGQVPGGSTLLYTCTVVGGPGDLTVSPTSAMSQFASALNAHGMTVTSSSNNETVLNALFGTGAAVSFQFQILDTIGNNLLSDAKSVCDGVMQGIVGNNIQTSNLSITSTPAGSPATVATGAAATATSLTTWLENNAIYIAGAVAALVLINNLTGKKR